MRACRSLDAEAKHTKSKSPHCRRRPRGHAEWRTNGRIGEAALQRHCARGIVEGDPRNDGLCPQSAHYVGYGTTNRGRQWARCSHTAVLLGWQLCRVELPFATQNLKFWFLTTVFISTGRLLHSQRVSQLRTKQPYKVCLRRDLNGEYRGQDFAWIVKDTC